MGLSIKLDDNVIEPEGFREKADNPSSFKYYQPSDQGLKIYHNQPINKNDIGLIDLKNKSILAFDAKVVNDNLVLSHGNNTIAKVENWSTDSPAREMMFAFNDITITNSKCIRFYLQSRRYYDGIQERKIKFIKRADV